MGSKELVVIALQIITLLLFISAHYLVTIYYYSKVNLVFGVVVDVLIIDMVLWSGIILQIIIILLLIKSLERVG